MHTVTANTEQTLFTQAVSLLKQLIATPSVSRQEHGTAAILQQFFSRENIPAERLHNNVWAKNKYFDPAKPAILLNSHHDTVAANQNYTQDPYSAIESDGKLYGLGSNDAGGCLVSLIATFLHFYDRQDMKYNIIIAASGEEEVSGLSGISALLAVLPQASFGIVGEPTKMEMAVAEKGLLVIDCTATGAPGHAARNEGDNAIYKAMKDIEWFKSYSFPKVSSLLGPVKMTVTIINAGTQHNVVPGSCTFTVDCRLNECYTHEEVLKIIQEHVDCEIVARSIRLRSTSIADDHPIVVAGKKLHLNSFGSSTMSDKALMPFPALKIGPGDSARSHTADEFIYLDEIKEGISTYIKLLNEVL